MRALRLPGQEGLPAFHTNSKAIFVRCRVAFIDDDELLGSFRLELSSLAELRPCEPTLCLGKRQLRLGYTTEYLAVVELVNFPLASRKYDLRPN